MTYPLVSILIPAYKAKRWLAESIESALAQTYANIEVVVVDDGSEDGTLEMAQEYRGGRVQVIAQENAGACVARNRALAEARGEFVKFLDADDALAPDAVEIQVAHARTWEDRGRVVVFGDVVLTDEALRPVPPAPGSEQRYPEDLSSEDLARRVAALLAVNVQTSLPLHRREWLDEVGGFRAHLERGQEYDLHLRLALAGVRFLHLSHIVTYLRCHSSPHRITNTSPLLADPSAYLAVQTERVELLESYLGRPLPSMVVEPLAQGLWGHTRRLVRAGETEAAAPFAAETAALDPAYQYAGRLFGLLSGTIGPVRAEQVLMRIKKLLGRR